ncbi:MULTISPECIES: hypothetical protein [Sphingobacterium]|nr:MULTISPECIES: hypothetical protein [Sphingobacterium]MDH5825884.1 hypothetical protein [Sphingobacterium faecium]
MWYFILALLFGNPSDSHTNNDQTVMQTNSDPEKSGGGDKGHVQPGK